MSNSAKKITRKILTLIPAAGATLTVGIMAFAGALVVTSSLPICIAAVALAVGWEAQINYEGISITLKRLFDPDYTAHQVLEKYALKDLEIAGDCKKHKKYIRALSEQISHLHTALHVLMDRRKRDEIETRIQDLKKKKKNAKQQMREALMQWELEKNRDDPLVTTIKNEIRSRKHWLALGWIVSIAAGISAGFATLGSLAGSLGTITVILPFIGAIPPVALVIASVIAGAGYTFLMYQTISDMLHDTSHVWKKLFQRQILEGERESDLRYGLRLAGTVLAVVLAVFATIATAGTFWYAIKDGTNFMGFGARIANVIRAVSVPLMAIPTFIFSSQNSVESVNRISRTPFRQVLRDIGTDLAKTRGNPFLIIERLIFNTVPQLMLGLHSWSIGLMGDRMPGINPWFSIITGGGAEYLMDYNYKPTEAVGHHDHRQEHGDEAEDEHEHHHHHESFLLSALFLPFNAFRVMLKGLGATTNYCTRQIQHRLSSVPQPSAPCISDCFREVFAQPEPHQHDIHAPQYGSFFWKNVAEAPANVHDHDSEADHDHHHTDDCAAHTTPSRP